MGELVNVGSSCPGRGAHPTLEVLLESVTLPAWGAGVQSPQSPYSKHWWPSWDILHPQLHLRGASTTNTAPELGERVWRESTFP